MITQKKRLIQKTPKPYRFLPFSLFVKKLQQMLFNDTLLDK